MSLTRFNLIKGHLTFTACPSNAQERQQRGDFWAVQPLIDAFNEARRLGFKSGWKVVVDESFSEWLGKDSRHLQNGCPHVVKEERKPKRVGMEFKNMACATSGIMMALEIVACGDEMQRRKYCDEYTSGAGTSLLMRLSETAGIKGSGRVAVADSAFASVQSATELRNRMGVHLIGLVKTATKKFPHQYFEEQPQLPQGEFVALTAINKGVNLRALSWHDKKRKNLIATCGTTLDGEPHKKKRWRNFNNGKTEYFTASIPRPNIVETYFDAAQHIDVHNYLRQGSVACERPTHRWMFRIFQTIVGMVEVDAFLAHQYECA